MMKSKALAIIALAALSLTACSTAAPSGGSSSGSGKLDTAKPYLVVIGAGLTGAQATNAKEEIRSAEVAAKLINSQGGVLGRKVVVESYDTKSDPTEAVSQLQKRLSSGTKPDLVRPGLSSAETLATAPVLTREKILAWTDASSPLVGDATAYPYLKLIGGSASQTADFAKGYVLQQGVKNLALFASQDATGDGQLAALTELYKGTSVKLSVFRYSVTDLDLSIAYQRVVDSKPDMIYYDGASQPLVQRVVDARAKVPGATAIPVLGGSGTSGTISTVATTATKASLKDFHTTLFGGQVVLPKADQSDSWKYWVKNVGHVNGMVSASEAFDGLRMWAKATNDAKTTDPDKVLKQFYAEKWPAGFFATWGNAKITWTNKSTFPVLPKDAYKIVQVAAPSPDSTVSQFQSLDLYPAAK